MRGVLSLPQQWFAIREPPSMQLGVRGVANSILRNWLDLFSSLEIYMHSTWLGGKKSVFFRALSIWQMYDNQLAINIYMKTPQGYDGCVLKPHTSPECPTSIRNNIATYVETGRKRCFWLFGSQGDIIRWHVRGKADISVAHGHSIDQRSQVVLPSWPLLPPAAGLKALYCFGNMNPALAENKQGAVYAVIL